MELRDKRYEDVKLIFKEDEHKYTDTLGRSYLSTTTMLHNYAPKFNKAYWLNKKAKDLGISTSQLEKQWNIITKEACEQGTKYHNNLEDNIKAVSMFQGAVKYMKRENGEMITIADIPDINQNIKALDIKEFQDATENKYPEIYNVFKYYTERDYKIYSEIGAFLLDYLVSGTIDILCLREDQFVIGDWKTNRGGLKFEAGYYKKDMSSKPNQHTNEFVTKSEYLLPPLNHLPNCNGSIYNLQLSQYALFVETILNIPCAGLWLCHIDRNFVLNQYGMPKLFIDGYHTKPNPFPKTTFYKMRYLKDEIIGILRDRRNELIASGEFDNKLF